MKLTAILAFTAAAEAAAVDRPEKRQNQGALGLGLLQSITIAAKKPTTEAFKKTKLQAQLFPTAVRERVTWGPFTLNPANVRSSYEYARKLLSNNHYRANTSREASSWTSRVI